MSESVETVVVGAGPSGLALSHELQQAGREHVVLERGRLVERWRSERWDSLTLLTPNWMTRFPGSKLPDRDPDAFAPRDEFVEWLEAYSRSFEAPVRTGVDVLGIWRDDRQDRYLVETSGSAYQARNVVVATGPGDCGAVPALGSRLLSQVVQLHSSQYRNPRQLPEGAVLVVGSGASGLQIADELTIAGRRVFLSVGRIERSPRSYRGKDVFWWAERMGALDAPYLAGRAGPTHPPSPAISGVAGGKELDPRTLARAGVVLFGRVTGADATGVELGADLRELLAAGDASAVRWRRTIDDYIATSGISAPEPALAEAIRPLATELEPVRRLDLLESRVACVIWATGFRASFDWVHAPVFADGVVQQTRGVTDSPGLFFLRVFPHKRRSQLLYGLGEDVAHIVERIQLR